MHDSLTQKNQPVARTNGRPRPRLSRAAVNFIVDACLFLNLVILLWIILLLNVIFPPATGADGYVVWGIGYDSWNQALLWTAGTFTFGILLHLILHWNWVCSFVRSRVAASLGRSFVPNPATNTLYGVSVLIGVFLVGGALLTLAELALTAPQ